MNPERMKLLSGQTHADRSHRLPPFTASLRKYIFYDIFTLNIKTRCCNIRRVCVEDHEFDSVLLEELSVIFSRVACVIFLMVRKEAR